MATKVCSGWVEALSGQVVTFTGRVIVKGIHRNRAECGELVEACGARPAADVTREVTVLVHGSFDGIGIADPVRGNSRKLLTVHRLRSARAAHVHVIDSEGLAALLGGDAARCRRVHASGATAQVVRVPGEGALGGPLRPKRPIRHNASELRVDLSDLDKGTEAHEATVDLLRERLSQRGIIAERPAGSGPQFDVGWLRARTLFIAEVKSLTGAREDQQIRLGIGQVLDYRYQVSQKHPAPPVGVLVLERKPSDARWEGIARSTGVVLTWGSQFPGI